MRLLALTLALAAFSAMATEYPLWKGEPIEEYAKKVGLPPTKTIDLGNGVTMEFVLIPPGKFIMGADNPPLVDEEAFRRKMLRGQLVLALGIVALLFLLGVVLKRCMRERQRPQYSLAWLLAMAIASGTALFGGLHWLFSTRSFAKARNEYEATLASYKKYMDDQERPAHWIALSRPFYFGKLQVSQAQYQQVMGTNPSNVKILNFPVEQVSWEDAQAFCKKASKNAPRSLRLPTEAEWEYVCRGGQATQSSAAVPDANSDDVGRSRMCRSKGKALDRFGVHDMHGDILEWCSDWFDYYSPEAVVDPQGPAQGDCRVFRGGCWADTNSDCGPEYRAMHEPNVRINYLGFRAVLDVTP